MFQTNGLGKIKAHFTHFTLNDFFENRADCELMWENIVEWDRPQMAIKWRHGVHAIYVADK
jgi:hypothetical protein